MKTTECQPTSVANPWPLELGCYWLEVTEHWREEGIPEHLLGGDEKGEYPPYSLVLVVSEKNGYLAGEIWDYFALVFGNLRYSIADDLVKRFSLPTSKRSLRNKGILERKIGQNLSGRIEGHRGSCLVALGEKIPEKNTDLRPALEAALKATNSATQGDLADIEELLKKREQQLLDNGEPLDEVLFFWFHDLVLVLDACKAPLYLLMPETLKALSGWLLGRFGTQGFPNELLDKAFLETIEKEFEKKL